MWPFKRKVIVDNLEIPIEYLRRIRIDLEINDKEYNVWFDQKNWYFFDRKDQKISAPSWEEILIKLENYINTPIPIPIPKPVKLIKD